MPASAATVALRLGAAGDSGPEPLDTPVDVVTEADADDEADAVGVVEDRVFVAAGVAMEVDDELSVDCAVVDDAGRLVEGLPTSAARAELLGATEYATPAGPEPAMFSELFGIVDWFTVIELLVFVTLRASVDVVGASGALGTEVTAVGFSEATAESPRNTAVIETRPAAPSTQVNRQPRRNRARAEPIECPRAALNSPSMTLCFKRSGYELEWCEFNVGRPNVARKIRDRSSFGAIGKTSKAR